MSKCAYRHTFPSRATSRFRPCAALYPRAWARPTEMVRLLIMDHPIVRPGAAGDAQLGRAAVLEGNIEVRALNEQSELEWQSVRHAGAGIAQSHASAPPSADATPCGAALRRSTASSTRAPACSRSSRFPR